MNTKSAFLSASSRLALGFHELSCYRILGNTLAIAVIDVHVRNREAYKNDTSNTVEQIRKISPNEFGAYLKIFEESFLSFSHSWLESYLDHVEEVIFLNSPDQIGESIPIKLGKLLEAKSIDELIHDLIRKKIRDRGQWSSKNRIDDLKSKHNFTFTYSLEDINWISELRNSIIHDRSPGRFKILGKKLSFSDAERKKLMDSNLIYKYLRIITATISDLYSGTCISLKVSKRNKLHLRNMKLLETIKKSYEE